MARHPEWYLQLEPALAKLRQSPAAEILDRSRTEELFRLSRRDAIRLLHRLGARQKEGRLEIARTDVIAQLEAVQRGSAYQIWQASREQKLQKMGEARRTLTARRVPVEWPPDADFRVANLPPSVQIAPGQITVSFATEEQLWRHLALLGRTAATDRAAFRAAIAVSPA